MAKATVKMDSKDLAKLKSMIQDPQEVDTFLRACAKELAARLIAKVVKRTPVGVYPKGTGKKGGTLRRGWTGDSKANAASYAQSLKVAHVGKDYVIEIINPVKYAEYVEYGHRTRNHRGWIQGQFMLTISEKEIQNSAPQILQAKLEKHLKGLIP